MTCNERIAVDGAALSIIERGEQWLHVETMPETLRCTRLESLQQVAFFAPRFPTLTYDRRGLGRSSHPDHQDTVAILDFLKEAQ